ncbi:MAG: sigma-70 family RNA polymerase sigma factor [Ferruginibacter sp.]|nr:sigma-70 family RNA polymerase sigma factor [Bacteroidota bacterium]MBX2919413.1 sigma-70 family RNA polymerase sigma factor [Ferruginibacter sp.]MCB0708098.1 sigma-70 family RNA polymerase sigma factor [Chitinophagaceae bacterium]
MPEIIKYTEEELVLLLKKKDQQAFSYLYDNYAGALNGVINRMVNNRELAEDILQEAFVKIWNNFDNYDTGKGRLFTWMMNITRNLTIDTMRSKGYKKQAKIFGDEYSVSNLTGDNKAVERFDAMDIRNQLSNLKPEQKDIIDLAYFNGFTQEEISKQMGIPLGTVKTRMRTAILELRKMLHNK